MNDGMQVPGLACSHKVLTDTNMTTSFDPNILYRYVIQVHHAGTFSQPEVSVFIGTRLTKGPCAPCYELRRNGIHNLWKKAAKNWLVDISRKR